MKLKDKPRVDLLYLYDSLVIPLEKGQDWQSLLQEDFDLTKDYEIIIREKKKKRSLDANAYFWTLLRQLATKMKLPYMEVYKNIVCDYGVYQIVPIKDVAIEKWIEVWENKGTGDGKGKKSGWFCEDIGECKNYKGYHNIKCYYGTSSYNSSEFSTLLDGLISMCTEQGIPTVTPRELAKILGKDTG